MAGFTVALREVFTAPWVHWMALLFLCAAYLQGGLDKLRDFPAAVAEMRQFGLRPAAALAVLTIVLEFAASFMVLTGQYRWLGALMLAAFTLTANVLADRFWQTAGPERRKVANAFFEHVGLAGGFLLVAWHDLGGRHAG